MLTRLYRLGVIGLMLAALLAGTAWGAPLTVTGKDNGKTLTVPVGQQLVVELNLGAGQYLVAPEFDAAILALLGQSLTSTSGPKGSSSRVVYTFLVKHPGRSDIVISARHTDKEGSRLEPVLSVKIVATGGGVGV
jgi:hypothetical protein